MKLNLGIALAALTLSNAAVAQAGPGPQASYYDPATVTTVAGEVTAVHEVQGKRGTGVHLTLKSADTSYDVHLGPASFLAGKSFEVKQGDEVEVTGSKIQFQGKPAIIAQSVRKGDATLTLRDAQGVPAWAGGPKRKN
jgi:hypothetical protein